MTLTEISNELGTSVQNISQIASNGIKKLFKNVKSTYKLSYLETYEMLLVGLDLYSDLTDVNYLYNQLDKKDQKGIEAERKKGKHSLKI